MKTLADLPKCPRPPRCNPFKDGGAMADTFRDVLRGHMSGHKDLRRGAGNAIASAFWKGYDGIRPSYIASDTLAWAAFRCGQYVRTTTK